MPGPSGDKSSSYSSRLSKLGIVLPASPTPLGAYVEASDTGNLLFISGTLPVINRKLAMAGRLGESLSVKDGQEARASLHSTRMRLQRNISAISTGSRSSSS